MPPPKAPRAYPYPSSLQLARGDDRRGPRNLRSPSPSSASGAKSRISHACDRCRTMRTKCSGGDRCSKCIKDDAACVYGDRKRERNKKDLAESLDRIDELEDEKGQLLAALRAAISSGQTDVPTATLDLIAKLSADYSPGLRQGSHSHSASSSSLTQGRRPEHNSDDTEPKDGEKKAKSEVGSPGHQGELSHLLDLNHGTGLSGYVGKMSGISWIQRCREHIVDMAKSSGVNADFTDIEEHASDVQNFTYYMDNQNLLVVDEDHINPHQWPPFQVALILSEAYFHAVQGSLSFIIYDRFMENLSRYPRNKPLPSWSERRWLALANIVWAIGAKWIELANLDHPTFPESHLVYYARARALGLDHRILFDHPDVEMVQSIGLMSLYLLTNGSISKAWNTLGQAIRHSTALGLHLKVTDLGVDVVERGNRAQTWCSLYDLEILMSEITGRPKAVHQPDTTVPKYLIDTALSSDNIAAGHEVTINSRNIWLSFLQRNQGMDDLSMSLHSDIHTTSLEMNQKHFAAHHSLCEISDEIGQSLYVGHTGSSWYDTQQTIQRYQDQLMRWKTTIPEIFQLSTADQRQSVSSRPRYELAMYYHSLSMILHRPCLCEIQIEEESETSKEFNRASARSCVDAALAMIKLMPDNPNGGVAYRLFPWWALLHYITQATSVLLMELCLDAQHFRGDINLIVSGIFKSMAYLWGLAGGSKSAYKAYRILGNLIREITPRYNDEIMSELANIPSDAPRPPEWTEDEESKLRSVLR